MHSQNSARTHSNKQYKVKSTNCKTARVNEDKKKPENGL